MAREALAFAQRYGAFAQLVLVNAAAGVLVAEKGKPFSVMGFTVRHDKVTEIDILGDPARL